MSNRRLTGPLAGLFAHLRAASTSQGSVVPSSLTTMLGGRAGAGISAAGTRSSAAQSSGGVAAAAACRHLQTSAAITTPAAAAAAAAAAGVPGRRRPIAAAVFSGSRRTLGRHHAGLHAAAAAEPEPALPEPSDAAHASALVPAAPQQLSLSAAAPAPAQAAAVQAAPAAAAAAAAAADTVTLEGTVQHITWRAEDTGYTVMRFQVSGAGASGASGGSSSGSGTAATDASDASSLSSLDVDSQLAAAAAAAGGTRGARGRRPVITAVGHFHAVAVGQALRLRGGWQDHHRHGLQLRADDVEEVAASSEEELIAYLGGGAIPGVGSVTARSMVRTWGLDIEARLSRRDAVKALTRCPGIGLAKAEKIKEAWDASKGTREGVRYLKELGLPLPLAQRVAKKHAQKTVERVQQDPYAALALLSLPFSKVDALAARVGARHDLVSRATTALSQCLREASADEGHTYLPWHRLEAAARRLLREAALQHAAPWDHSDELHLVAQHMHATGRLVAEPPAPPADEAAEAAAQADGQLPLGGGGGGAAHLAPARLHPSFDGVAELRGYLASKLEPQGVKEATVDCLLAGLGEGVLAALDADPQHAAQQLIKCRTVGPKTAEKIKAAWEAAHGSGAGAGGKRDEREGLTMAELAEAPPALGFAWGPDVRCFVPHLHEAEQTVAQRVLQAAAAYREPSARQLGRVRKWLAANQATTDIQLCEGQRRAIELASDAPLLVLTGGPGCGKTTAVQTIVRLWCAQGKHVRIAAPTGRAAQRMGSIQGIEPSTIHRLLGYQPRNAARDGGAKADDAALQGKDEEWRGFYKHDRHDPLPAGAVLVDEASMLSLPLAAALVDALRAKCQLVLVGDVDQLPPVGPGAVLHSLIASGLAPVVDLREIFRQAAQSAIITSALAVRRGEVPMLPRVEASAGALEGAGSDALLVPAGPPAEMARVVREAVRALRAAHGYQTGEELDLQVISPMKKGPAGTSALNPMLQALINPPRAGRAELARRDHKEHAAAAGGEGGEARQHPVFRVGDRVIQQVNNYDKEVFNGDQGTVVSISPSERRMVVSYPHLPEGEQEKTYQGADLAELELAYAITVHKAQGGEAEHVVLALSTQHGRMLTRRLLYTGLTRAKQQLLVVSAGGDAAAATDPLAVAVRRKEAGARLTWLQERLEAGRLEAGLPQLEPQAFSNEEQMLAQAALWQAQAAEARLAERQHQQAAEAADQAALLQRVQAEMPGVDAEAMLQRLRQHSPNPSVGLATIEAALAWMQQRVSPGLTLGRLLREAPQLLPLRPDQLDQALRFAERAPGEPAGSGGGNGGGGRVESMRRLLLEAQAQRRQQQWEQQQWEPEPREAVHQAVNAD